MYIFVEELAQTCTHNNKVSKKTYEVIKTLWVLISHIEMKLMLITDEIHQTQKDIGVCSHVNEKMMQVKRPVSSLQIVQVV